VVGARPNFVKAAPVVQALLPIQEFDVRLVHTVQHYDRVTSEVFFEELGLPKPDINLGVGSGSHAQITAEIILQFQKVIEREKPRLVIVYGHVNSTVVCALVCSKLETPLAHVEAGLRSFDRSMPEESNRILTDPEDVNLFWTLNSKLT
jgi:UDP-N-acetylglucosamine 2-epimerase (non-hydrolysing)